MYDVTGDLMMIDKGIICHQVNIDGKIGAGLALQIKNKYPFVYECYKQMCQGISDKKLLLGKAQLVNVGTHYFTIVNVFAQSLYDECGNHRKTDYNAVDRAMEYLRGYILSHNPDRRVFFPDLMGCGFGGGSWTIYRSILEYYIPYGYIVHYVKDKDPFGI